MPLLLTFAALEGKVPFITSLTVSELLTKFRRLRSGITQISPDMLNWDAVEAFRRRALNPEHPCQEVLLRTTDIFFQAREACNKYYDAVPEVVVKYMDKVNEKSALTTNCSTTTEQRMQSMLSLLWVLFVTTIEETDDYLSRRRKSRRC